MIQPCCLGQLHWAVLRGCLSKSTSMDLRRGHIGFLRVEFKGTNGFLPKGFLGKILEGEICGGGSLYCVVVRQKIARMGKLEIPTRLLVAISATCKYIDSYTRIYNELIWPLRSIVMLLGIWGRCFLFSIGRGGMTCTRKGTYLPLSDFLLGM